MIMLKPKFSYLCGLTQRAVPRCVRLRDPFCLPAISHEKSYCSITSILESIPPSHVPLIKDRYKDISRRPFKVVKDDDLVAFREILNGDAARVVTDSETLEAVSCDWLRSLRGESPCLLRPKNTEEVSGILKYCFKENIAVVPQGGNTSMVGGSIPIFDEVIINTGLLNKVELVDATSGSFISGPGVTLREADKLCRQKGLYFPVDYNVRDAQLGGIVAADIAGPRTMRFGSMHSNVVGLEVVFADGRVMDSMSTMKKDNTGYDLKQLFIGSEGTLGIITKLAVACPTLPRFVNVAMLSCDSYDNILRCFHIAKEVLGEAMSACEFYDKGAISAVKKAFWSLWRVPSHPFSLLVETSGVHDPHDEAKLDQFIARLKGEGLVVDSTIAKEPEQVEQLWSLYNKILTSLVSIGYVHQFDVSLPQSEIYGLIEYLRIELKDTVEKVVGYGHLFDGTLDLSVLTRTFDPEQADRIEALVFDFVERHRGAISAELGCGFKYRNLGHYSKDCLELELQTGIKDLIDPKGILNPYKVLPDPGHQRKA